MKDFDFMIFRRLTAVVCAAALLPFAAACGGQNAAIEPEGESCTVKAFVLTADENRSNTYDMLVNGIAANIDVEKGSLLPARNVLNDTDIFYLEADTASAPGFDAELIESYVYNGGTVVLANNLLPKFSKEFLGAEELAAVEGCPAAMEFPETDISLKRISGLLSDYTSVFRDYVNFDSYSGYNYGYGIVPSTAQVIGSYNGLGIYTMNNYGDGHVFVTNPMLPDEYTVASLAEGEQGQPFAFSTAAAGNLLRSYYAEFVSTEKYGFAAERTFGSFGSRPAAWELHYEDITGVNNNALETFSEMCMSEGQMPSYTMARNFYTWFKRAESVTYLISDGTGSYRNDVYENAYCSGTHIVSSGKWLEMDSYEKTESYFDDSPEYTKRAYPCPVDFNGDGKLDFICGSADGHFYLYQGTGMKNNYETGPAIILTDKEGNALSVGAYSSPALYDIDADGEKELLSGSESGTVFAFKRLKSESNPDSLAFELMGAIIETGLPDAMIDAGDISGDGTVDIAVGSRSGAMRVYYGYSADGYKIDFENYDEVQTNQVWASPCIYAGELFGGTLEGYVAHYVKSGEGYAFERYLKCDDISRRGDDNVSIGMNSVPRFADIDGDGNDDLICGSLEYGMAYPIDSEYFPYTDKLKQQLEFCERNNIYMGVHGFTHQYATVEHEKRELEYHKNAFDAYGIKWDGKGANQHTWFTSKFGYDGSGRDGYNPDYNGSFATQLQAGLLWNSGAMMPESEAVPQISAEDAIPMPIYMNDNDFLLMETSNTPHGSAEYSALTVKYDMPLLFYNHCDYIYEASDEQIAAVKKVGEIVDSNDYMFVGEDQMAKAVAAAYNTDITVLRTGNDLIIKSSVRDEKRGLYSKAYSECAGIKLIFGANDSAKNYAPDANVWNREDNAIYLGLDKTVRLSRNNSGMSINVKQINIPSKVKIDGNSAVIEFLESGFMCVRVAGMAVTDSEGWTSKSDENGDTIFMKFGQAQRLKIKAGS